MACIHSSATLQDLMDLDQGSRKNESMIVRRVHMDKSITRLPGDMGLPSCREVYFFPPQDKLSGAFQDFTLGTCLSIQLCFQAACQRYDSITH